MFPNKRNQGSSYDSSFKIGVTPDKRGQMKLSFGMIFSIFLIIIFIAFAIYAITKFLNLQKTIQLESFSKDLQTHVDAMWKSPKGSQEETYFLPNHIEAVCFTNDEFNNLMFRSSNYPDEENIKHIDLAKITSSEDPYCIPNTDGKVKLTISKDFGEELVTITR
ncbi:hypothetical protein KAI04_02595 [Candidatus Pacearchaeota archaeon]|nr:hypothetical protein [Candidatus Pacearchaeota archaeon]